MRDHARPLALHNPLSTFHSLLSALVLYPDGSIAHLKKPAATVTRTFGIFALAAVCLLAGCAPKHVALNEEAIKRIKTVKVVSVIPQHEVVPTVPPSTGEVAAVSTAVMFGAIGGAIGGGIAASIAASHYHAAEAKLQPLTIQTKEIDVRKDFADGLRRAADGSDRLIVQEEVTVNHPFGNSDRKQMLNEMTEDALLIVTTDYYFSPDFRVLNVRNRAELWPKDGGDILYRGEWYVHSVPHGPQEGDNGAEQDIAAWAENQAAAYRTTEHEAVEESELMERMELFGAHIETDLGMMPVSYASPNRGQRLQTDGKILLRQNGWTIVRTKDGNLHALQSPKESEEPKEPVEQGSPAPDQTAPAPVQENGAP